MTSSLQFAYLAPAKGNEMRKTRLLEIIKNRKEREKGEPLTLLRAFNSSEDDEERNIAPISFAS